MRKFRVFLIFFIALHGFSDALPKFDSHSRASDVATPNVDELNSPLESVADSSNDEIRAFYTPPRINAEPPETSSDPPPTKRRRWHFGCNSENTERSTRSLENVDLEDKVALEVRDGPQQPQPMPMQQQQMPMQPMQGQQMPQMQVPNPQMQMANPQMQMPNPQMQMPNPQMQMPNPHMQVQPQPGTMQPGTMQPGTMQPGTMQPTMGGTMQMHPQDGQFHGQYPQPQSNMMGQPAYPAYPTQPITQPMAWPANTGAIVPGATGLPYSGYPPTGQMQMPIPANQFTGYGPASAYTNPVYNTPLSNTQNDQEAQIATAFLFTQLSNMMRDPSTRESVLYFITELRSFLSNPNAVPFMRALNHRAQDIMNSPASYNQHAPPNLPHSTSTIVQVQDGANHLLDKVKAKGGTIMSFVKEMANANSRMLENTTSDIPGVNSVVKIGTGLANAGVGFIDGLLSPWLQPSGHGGTTITTVSTPQNYPTTQYQTPTSITVGK